MAPEKGKMRHTIIRRCRALKLLVTMVNVLVNVVACFDAIPCSPALSQCLHKRCCFWGSGASLAGPCMRSTRHARVFCAMIFARIAGGEDCAEEENFPEWDSDIEKQPQWNRSVRIGFSDVVQSIRIIPADTGSLLGGKANVPDHSISEWFWADPASAGASRAPDSAPVLCVPDDVSSVHHAVAACPEGGVIAVSSGLFRWDGVIKLRKGLSRQPQACSSALKDGAGIHLRGVDGSVLMGRWLLGRHSAGSLSHLGLAGNLSVTYEVVLDVHAGPWLLQNVECRSVGGGLVHVSEWGEVLNLLALLVQKYKCCRSS